MNIWIKRLVRIFVILALFLGINFVIQIHSKMESYKSYIYNDVTSTPAFSVALVFGAGLKKGGLPSDVLSDRVLSAVELYKAGKVKKILMSGDNSTRTYDEVNAMKKLAVDTGVQGEDIVLDYAGFDTYDSCYRAKEIFGLSEAIAVSQEFHLPRVLYTCNELGLKTVGYASDKHVYVKAQFWKVREFLAQIKAGLDVQILHSKPKFLGPKEKVL